MYAESSIKVTHRAGSVKGHFSAIRAFSKSRKEDNWRKLNSPALNRKKWKGKAEIKGSDNFFLGWYSVTKYTEID